MKTPVSVVKTKICKQCMTEFDTSSNARVYCSDLCRARYKHIHKSLHNNATNYQAQKLRGLNRKLHFISVKGGKCEICGYNKNISALCFHHVDPSVKEVSLDIRHLSNGTMATLSAEVEKCQLLCHNCHMEIHHPSGEISNFTEQT